MLSSFEGATLFSFKNLDGISLQSLKNFAEGRNRIDILRNFK